MMNYDRIALIITPKKLGQPSDIFRWRLRSDFFKIQIE